MPDTIMIKSIPNIHKKPKRKQQFLPIIIYTTVSMDFEQNNDFKTGKSIQNIITIHLHTVNYHQMETHRMENPCLWKHTSFHSMVVNFIVHIYLN